MSDLLLRAEPEDYARLVARRWRQAIGPVVICLLIATAILVIEYRLMIIAFIVITPAIISVIDPIMVGKSARRMGSVAVRWEDEWLILNGTTRFRFAELILARTQPDAIVLTSKVNEQLAAHVLPAAAHAQQALLAVLRGRNIKIPEEPRTPAAAIVFFLFGVLGNLLLGKVAGVLVLAALLYAAKRLIDGHGPGWEAAAFFGGAVVCLTLKALIHHFLMSAADSAKQA